MKQNYRCEKCNAKLPVSTARTVRRSGHAVGVHTTTGLKPGVTIYKTCPKCGHVNRVVIE